jgi:hypothetical protein
MWPSGAPKKWNCRPGGTRALKSDLHITKVATENRGPQHNGIAGLAGRNSIVFELQAWRSLETRAFE